MMWPDVAHLQRNTNSSSITEPVVKPQAIRNREREQTRGTQQMASPLLVLYSVFVIADTIVECGIDYLHHHYYTLSPETLEYLACLTD